jgi:hypothetical protein
MLVGTWLILFTKLVNRFNPHFVFNAICCYPSCMYHVRSCVYCVIKTCEIHSLFTTTFCLL